MLPHNHFLIAALSIFLLSILLFPQSPSELARWILVGGIISALIDMDVVALVYWKSRSDNRLRPFRNPAELYKNYGLFMDRITESGILSLGIKTHLIISILIILIFYAIPEFFVPVFIAVVTHILSDVPSIQRLRAA